MDTNDDIEFIGSARGADVGLMVDELVISARELGFSVERGNSIPNMDDLSENRGNLRLHIQRRLRRDVLFDDPLTFIVSLENEEIELYCVGSIIPGKPTNELGLWYAYSFISLFEMIAKIFVCSEAHLISRWKTDRKELVFLGDHNRIHQFQVFSVSSDFSANLFLKWLQNPNEEIHSDERPHKWCEHHTGSNLDIVSELPIRYEPTHSRFVLLFSGGQRALIGHNLVNGRLIPLGDSATEGFFSPDTDIPFELLQRTLRMQSIEQVIENFGEPDLQLPPVKWIPRSEEFGCRINYQLVYNNLSRFNAYVFRVWDVGVVTIVALPKSKPIAKSRPWNG